jgi:hypothetical protein
VEKELLAGGENKFGAAIDAGEYLILKFHLRRAPFCPSFAGRDGAWQTQVLYIPQTAPGLGLPRTQNVA